MMTESRLYFSVVPVTDKLHWRLTVVEKLLTIFYYNVKYHSLLEEAIIWYILYPRWYINDIWWYIHDSISDGISFTHGQKWNNAKVSSPLEKAMKMPMVQGGTARIKCWNTPRRRGSTSHNLHAESWWIFIKYQRWTHLTVKLQRAWPCVLLRHKIVMHVHAECLQRIQDIIIRTAKRATALHWSNSPF